MKKIILTLTLIATQILLFGQDSITTIGIKINSGVASIYNSLDKNINFSRFSTNAGLEIRHGLFKNKIFIESGLNFIDRGYKVNQQTIDINGNNIELMKSKEIEYYLSLPIIVSYKFKGIFIGAGPNINYFLARRFIVDGKLISADSSYQKNTIIFGGQCFLGYEMGLSDNLLISFDGYVNLTFKVHFINYGLGIGLKYILIKHKK
jgi:hypothetical protein